MTFLEKLIASKRASIAPRRRAGDLDAIKQKALHQRETAIPNRFRDAVNRTDRTNIIAEIKRASPSRGVINDSINVVDLAKKYSTGGAAAISVLTETEYFRGSLGDLRGVRAAVDLPILRKDFIVDELQIYESAACGADAILLIVGALVDEDLEKFLLIARDELRMDALVEVHTADDLSRAKRIGAEIIGVNNRNLHSLEVSLDTSRDLIGLRHAETLMIAESGITTRAEIDELQALGYNGFLIGETLMKADDTETVLRQLTI